MSERMASWSRERRVAPSILSADFSQARLPDREVMDAGARVIHFDVMDGHFVPPITIGPLVAASIADQVHDAGGAVDVHLMIEAPERQIEAFAEAGADSITFHVEATAARQPDPRPRSASSAAWPGSRSTPARRPRRSPSCAGLADIVLCMTVNPGWGGQAFIPGSPDKVAAPAAARRRRQDRGRRRHRRHDRRPDRRGRRLPLRRRLRRLRRRRPRRRPTPRSPPPPARPRPFGPGTGGGPSPTRIGRPKGALGGIDLSPCAIRAPMTSCHQARSPDRRRALGAPLAPAGERLTAADRDQLLGAVTA